MSEPTNDKLMLMQSLLRSLPHGVWMRTNAAGERELVSPAEQAAILEDRADAILARAKPYAVAGLRLEVADTHEAADGLKERSAYFRGVLKHVAEACAAMPADLTYQDVADEMADALADGEGLPIEHRENYRILVHQAACAIRMAELSLAEARAAGLLAEEEARHA